MGEGVCWLSRDKEKRRDGGRVCRLSREKEKLRGGLCPQSQRLGGKQTAMLQCSLGSSRKSETCLSLFTTDENGLWRRKYSCEALEKRKLLAYAVSSAELCGFEDSAAEVHSLPEQEKIGVLLLNLGGPEILQDVQPFLFNLFADPDIIRLPRLFRFLQQPLAQLISVLLAPKSKESYASIGGGSPLRKITDELADALKKAVEAKNIPVNVYVGITPFPQVDQVYTFFKGYSGIHLHAGYNLNYSFENPTREDEYLRRLPVFIIESWYHREGYIKSMANLIEKELKSFRMPDESRVGPFEWLKPYTDKVLVELGQKGVKSLLAVPIIFVSVKNWGRVPALGCDPSFISDLADAVVEALPHAVAMTSAKPARQSENMDLVRSAFYLIFGFILAFVLLLSLKLVSAHMMYLR
ncbi:hypothetical protein AMTRI_Chr05g68410 [Amborella trichopoda]